MSALEFIQLALERGDQMFVKTDTVEMTGVELKHIWRDIAVNSDNVRKAVENYRMKYKG